MSRFDWFKLESRSCFYQSEEGQPTCARGLMHRVWLDFWLSLGVMGPKPQPGNIIRQIRLRGGIQHAVVESLQMVLREGGRVNLFAHVYGTLHWRARHNVGWSYDIDESTEHHHTFSGVTRFDLLKRNILSSSVWVPPEKLFFAGPTYGTDHLYAQELEDEMERIPETLYRKLVEHQPDERLRDFPWLGVAYRMAEYLLTRNELTGKTLMSELQQSCKTSDAKSALFRACRLWSMLANLMLIQEVNYQLFMLQIVSRWPNFRLHYRITSQNGQENASQEGWILPQQLQCFAYQIEPFWSLIGLLAQYGPEQAIELHPPEDRPHQQVSRWLLQYCGKIHMRDGHALFSGYLDCTDQIRLTFYL
jgi:hypothetical protein